MKANLTLEGTKKAGVRAWMVWAKMFPGPKHLPEKTPAQPKAKCDGLGRRYQLAINRLGSHGHVSSKALSVLNLQKGRLRFYPVFFG